MALHIQILQAILFLLGATFFMFIAARFTLDTNSLRRALLTTMVLSAVALVLIYIDPPEMLSVLSLLVVAVITIQTIYEVETKNAVLMIIVYMTVSTIFVILSQGVTQIIS